MFKKQGSKNLHAGHVYLPSFTNLEFVLEFVKFGGKKYKIEHEKAYCIYNISFLRGCNKEKLSMY